MVAGLGPRSQVDSVAPVKYFTDGFRASPGDGSVVSDCDKRGERGGRAEAPWVGNGCPVRRETVSADDVRGSAGGNQRAGFKNCF